MTSWGWGCPAGIVAQLIKKMLKIAKGKKRFSMAKPPHFSIQFTLLMIKAKFIPKSNSERHEIYHFNFN
jgi:hypothetical protein